MKYKNKNLIYKSGLSEYKTATTHIEKKIYGDETKDKSSDEGL